MTDPITTAAAMREVIAPCPFGCPPEIDEDQRSPHIVMNYIGPSPLTQATPPYAKSVKVCCAVCGCRGPEFVHNNWTREMADAEAVRRWNRRALPIAEREVPEVFKEWAGSFRTTVANADPEDIWPEWDFKLLDYLEKEYGL